MHIGENIKVIASFALPYRIRPVRFNWSGKQIDIKEITYEWSTLNGTNKLLHFSVTDGSTLYELSFDTNSIVWRLEGVETQ